MKKYSKPQTLVIPFNIRQCILSGSNPTGTNMYDDGFNSGSEALVRRGTFNLWDEDEEDE